MGLSHERGAAVPRAKVRLSLSVDQIGVVFRWVRCLGGFSDILQHALFAKSFNERRSIETEQFRGHRLVATGAPQSLLDETVFNALQHAVEVNAIDGQGNAIFAAVMWRAS